MNDDLWECPYCGSVNDRAEGCCYNCEADRQLGKDEIAADVLASLRGYTFPTATSVAVADRRTAGEQ